MLSSCKPLLLAPTDRVVTGLLDLEPLRGWQPLTSGDVVGAHEDLEELRSHLDERGGLLRLGRLALHEGLLDGGLEEVAPEGVDQLHAWCE